MNKATNLINKLYGEPLLKSLPPTNTSLPNILHVAAVYDDKEEYKIIRVDLQEVSPKSDEDFFVLNLARARADAIITSGKVVRDEEGLTHALQGSLAEDLAKYREEYLGKTKHPYSLIFTRGVPDTDAKIF